MNKEQIFYKKQAEISAARGKDVEKIGDFKRIGKEVYKMGRNIHTGEKTYWTHDKTLDDKDTLQNHINFLNDYRLEI